MTEEARKQHLKTVADSNLSFEAKGLLMHVLNREHRELWAEEIQKRNRKAVKEAEAAGFLVKRVSYVFTVPESKEATS